MALQATRTARSSPRTRRTPVESTKRGRLTALQADMVGETEPLKKRWILGAQNLPRLGWARFAPGTVVYPPGRCSGGMLGSVREFGPFTGCLASHGFVRQSVGQPRSFSPFRTERWLGRCASKASGTILPASGFRQGPAVKKNPRCAAAAPRVVALPLRDASRLKHADGDAAAKAAARPDRAAPPLPAREQGPSPRSNHRRGLSRRTARSSEGHSCPA